MTAHIKITEGVRLLPYFSASAKPTEIEAAANEAYADFMAALERVRATAVKLNECLPVKALDLSPLDEISNIYSDWLDDFEARADMVREAREWDR